mmetsp:Transcript_5266/g.7032  ORF Transcript_5266/g.7032 Transcript_5266/m.7032 type:complete len:198 (+) Transcript_5266:65-658(+)
MIDFKLKVGDFCLGSCLPNLLGWTERVLRAMRHTGNLGLRIPDFLLFAVVAQAGPQRENVKLPDEAIDLEEVCRRLAKALVRLAAVGLLIGNLLEHTEHGTALLLPECLLFDHLLQDHHGVHILSHCNRGLPLRALFSGLSQFPEEEFGYALEEVALVDLEFVVRLEDHFLELLLKGLFPVDVETRQLLNGHKDGEA